MNALDMSRYSSFSSLAQYDRFLSYRVSFGFRKAKILSAYEDVDHYKRMNPVPLHSSRSGFKIRTYASGEVTGGLFLTGRQSKCKAPSRTGDLETAKFTKESRQKIRRSCENAPQALKYFLTFTFAPESMKLQHALYIAEQKIKYDNGTFNEKTYCAPLNDDGTVNHKFAKQEFIRLLNTVAVRIVRQNKKYAESLKKEGKLTADIQARIDASEFLYLWTAEIQHESTHNIHFHLLTNKFIDVKWLKTIWKQANNSVNAKQMKNNNHAANYVSKYVAKENDIIKGNRYFICHKLREYMRPIEKILVQVDSADADCWEVNPALEIQDKLQAMKEMITASGGHVLDFGFAIPRPRQASSFVATATTPLHKKGAVIKTFAISQHLSQKVLAQIERELDEEDYPF